MSERTTTEQALVLDGQYCHALAAIRSLGRRGWQVDVASHKSRAQGFASRYRGRVWSCPDPNREAQAYTDWLFQTVETQPYTTLLSFEEATTEILSQHRQALDRYTSLRLPSRKSFRIASRKDSAIRLARDAGLHLAKSFTLDSLEDLRHISEVACFPLVVKGLMSSGSQQVCVARNAAELDVAVQRIAAMNREAGLPIVQEYIPGSGCGLTALMEHGKPLATFMHERLAEHDIAHGVQLAHGATGARSIHEPEMLRAGLSVLERLEWDGIAMVEFRRHAETGEFYFIEINPRFVGSLELAIACGVDLPWYLADLAAGRRPRVPAASAVGVEYRWLISKNVADAFERPWGYWRGVLTSWLPHVRTDICWRDPKPHLRHLRNAAWWIKNHLRGGSSPAQAAAAEQPKVPAG